MSKTPLMQMLRRAVRVAAADSSRRSFLRTGLLAGFAASVPSVIGACTRPRDITATPDFKVAVIGAGVAGLVAARNLHQSGADVSVYEGSMRTGGRMLSVDDFLVKGATTELGGEFIDSVHTDLLDLARSFELELIDLRKEPHVSRVDTYIINGVSYREADIVRELSPFFPRIVSDLESLPVDLADLSASPAHALDEMSMEAYFAHIGLTGWLRAFLETAFITENGLELGEQSALNFIQTIGTELTDPAFRLYGESDERFKIRGGNQQITDRLAGEVADRLHIGHQLERVGRVGNRYVLTFRTGSTSVDVLADAVVCAIPFSVLRTVQVDLDLPKTLRSMITELHYGENAKTLLGFDRPFWHDTNASGVVYTDLPIQLSWDNTALQGVQGAGLTMYSGGSTCRMLMSMNKADVRVLLLDALKAVWPDSVNEQVRRFERMNWSQAPYVKASYSSFGPGQWSQYYAAGKRSPDSTFVFAGEHMDDHYRGFMNGAARSGRLAAERLIREMSS